MCAPCVWRRYEPGLASRPCLVAGNKADVPGAAQALRSLRAAARAMREAGELPGLASAEEGGSVVTAISARDGRNLGTLVRRMHAALREAEARREQLQHEAIAD